MWDTICHSWVKPDRARRDCSCGSLRNPKLSKIRDAVHRVGQAFWNHSSWGYPKRRDCFKRGTEVGTLYRLDGTTTLATKSCQTIEPWICYDREDASYLVSWYCCRWKGWASQRRKAIVRSCFRARDFSPWGTLTSCQSGRASLKR